MIRTSVLASLAVLALSGCSGKTQAPDAVASDAAGATKPNPWSSDGAMPAPSAKPADAAAPAPAKDAAASAANKAAGKANPWAKAGAASPATDAAAAEAKPETK